MPKLFWDTDKYEGRATPAPIIEAFHGATKSLVRARFEASGKSWSEFVFGAGIDDITSKDFEAIDKSVLDCGYRYLGSAVISVSERPEAYQPMANAGSSESFTFEHPEAQIGAVEPDGRQQRGQGDNVVRYEHNIVGIARYYRNVQDVMRGISDGVPANTIAIIDDSGGTLTAPILQKFAGVICAGGTVRSHLGILTREYGIPSFMNAKVNGLFEGDLVEMAVSAPAKTNEAYQQGLEMSSPVWKLAPAQN